MSFISREALVFRSLSEGEVEIRERKEKSPGTPELSRWVAVFRLERAVFLSSERVARNESERQFGQRFVLWYDEVL